MSKLKKPVLLKSFNIPTRITLRSDQRVQLMRAINKHFLGDEIPNKVAKDGSFVPKYPEKETPEFNEMVASIHRTLEVDIPVEVYSDGSMVFGKIPDSGPLMIGVSHTQYMLSRHKEKVPSKGKKK